MTNRIFDDVLETSKPLQDSQYRLKPCKRCGSSEVVYAKYMGLKRCEGREPVTMMQEMWRVVCTGCFCSADIQSTSKHPVQIEWNRRN